MALITCKKCGKSVSDQAEKCPHCGTKVELETNSYGTLTIEWKGMWMAVDTDVYLTLNGQSVGERNCYSFIKGFSVDTPILSDYANIGVKAGKFLNDNIECKFEKGMNYKCTFSYSRLSGAYTYKITDVNGNIVCKKGLSAGRKIMCILGAILILFLVIVNIAIYIADEKEQNSYSTQTEQISPNTYNEQTTEQVTEEETTNTKTKYVYEFVTGGSTMCDDMPYRLTIDTEEKTAQLIVGVYDNFGRLTSEKKTFYGTCGYFGGDVSQPYIKGFTGADDYDIIISGDKYYWSSYKFIDIKNNYLYLGRDEFEAKNPDYRIKMTLVE